MTGHVDFAEQVRLSLAGLLRMRSQLLEAGFLLPSKWNEDGCGWQELPKEAQFAGFYASCEGLDILSFLPEGASPIPANIVERVYKRHLLPILATPFKLVPVPCQAQWNEVQFQVAKWAKFLAVTAIIPPSLHDPSTFQRGIDLLEKSQHRSGGWSPVCDSPASVHSAVSAEAIVALSHWPSASHKMLVRGIGWAVNCLKSSASTSGGNGPPRDLVFAAWALAQVGELLDASQLGELRQAIEGLVIHDGNIGAHEIGEFYYVKELERNDFYRFNSQLLIATTVLRACRLHIVDTELVKLVLPAISDASLQLSTTGEYISPIANKLRFWEYHQAFTVLREFVQLIQEQKSLERKSYMYVSPRHFQRRSFNVVSGLCVVIMPLNQQLSATVYKVISEVVESCGKICWRSDGEFRDDSIVQTVWEKLNEAEFVIADCTGRNANVFYELGIAHTLGKRVFMCAQTREDFVFDIMGVRNYVYGLDYEEMSKFKGDLTKFVRSL